MKLKLLLILSIFMIAFSSTSGEAPTNYLSYEDNNGEYCHGMHVGDKYYFTHIRGVDYLYANGTYRAFINGPVTFTIEITELPNISTISSRSFYSFNQTYLDAVSFTNQSRVKLGTFDDIYSNEKVFFTFLGWNAWKNTFNNRTQVDIEKNSGIEDLSKSSVHRYDNAIQTDEIFIHTIFINSFYEDLFETVSTYNKSDGTLLSEKKCFDHKLTDGYKKFTTWEETSLISKAKISEENVCPDRVIEITNSDDSTAFNFIYLVVLIPIIRIKRLRFKKKNYIKNNFEENR